MDKGERKRERKVKVKQPEQGGHVSTVDFGGIENNSNLTPMNLCMVYFSFFLLNTVEPASEIPGIYKSGLGCLKQW